VAREGEMDTDPASVILDETLGRLEALKARNAELVRALAATESSFFTVAGRLVARLTRSKGP
jgi:enoyl reductase-like protein